MVNPLTPNGGLIVPLTGVDVDLWGANDINPNMLAVDGQLYGVQAIGLTNVPVTLTKPAGLVPTPSGGPTQSQNAVLKLTGTVTGPVAITLPLPGYYIVDTMGLGAGSSNIPTMRAVGAGEVIGLPFGTVKHVYNDGTNVRFVNLPDVGIYWDYGGAAVPSWVPLCTVPPFLLCDGSVFSAVTYPILAAILGTTTLPDYRGRSSFYLNAGTGRLTAAGAGIDGNTRFASGGSDGVALTVNQIPAGVPSANAGVIGLSVSSTNLVISNTSGSPGFADLSGGVGAQVTAWGLGAITGHLTSTGSLVANAVNVTSTNGAQAMVHSTTPGVVGGIRMIRAG